MRSAMLFAHTRSVADTDTSPAADKSAGACKYLSAGRYAAFGIFLVGFPAMAADLATGISTDQTMALSGSKTIKLSPVEGDQIVVGSIDFAPEGDLVAYRINWDDSAFTDQFLSMRPFKCLDGPDKMWCRVPYPYENRRTVDADDLTDLEYDLLFVWKRRNDYGIDMWNGVYYRLSIEGGELHGQLHELDLDQLSAPPEDGNLRPIGEADLTEGEATSHWLPGLNIE